jgi:hypothetical protein
MHGQRCRRNKRDKQAERDTLLRLKVQQRRSSMTAVKCFKHQCFSSVLRSGVTLRSQRFMVFVLRLASGHYADFVTPALDSMTIWEINGL